MSCGTVNKYVIGSEVRFIASPFRNSDGVIADPTNIVLTIKQPDGTDATAHYPGDIVKDSVGVYHYDFVPAQAGSHFYRWESTGSVVAVDERQFIITPSIVIS